MMNSEPSWHFNKEEQRKLKRQRLIKAAAECFNQKGFSGTSLKDVAQKLNITDAALYHYVTNKEELVNLCYMRATDIAEEALNAACEEGKTPEEKLKLFVRYQITRVTGPDGPVAIMSEIAALKDGHRELILERATKHQKRIARLIEEGAADGSLDVPDPIAACNALLGAINWIPKWHKKTTKLKSDEIADNFIHMFFNGMTVRK